MTNLQSIQKECLEEKIDVADAVSQINHLVGGITRVDFKEGKKFKIANHHAMFALNVKGIKNREINRLHGIAVVAYFQAKENGSLQPGEVHISKKASTKHYMDGIYKILEKYAG